MKHREITIKKKWDWNKIFTDEAYADLKEKYDASINQKLKHVFEEGFHAIRFEKEGGRYSILTHSLRDAEAYTLSYFDSKGPIMHEDYYLKPNEKETYENRFERLCSVIHGFSEDKILMDII